MPQFNSTASIVPITIFGGEGQIAFLPPGVLTSSFNVTGSAVDTLINETSSFVMEFETGSSAFQFRIPSESAGVSTDIIPLFITSSGEKPLIGFGTKTPQSTLDIRSITSSSPANILLRTNEDGAIQVGEETGRIEFAIESASFLGTDFIVSGSTAAMFSRVVESSAVGAIGNLVFTVNKSLGTSTTPIDAVVIGKGATTGFDGIGMAISGNMEIASSAPLLSVRNDNGTEIARLGGHSPFDFSDGQLLLYNQNTQSVKFNGDAAPADASFIKFGNLALGGTTAGERLTVTGSISISGSGVGHITASGNISSSGEIFGSTGSFSIIQGGTF